MMNKVLLIQSSPYGPDRQPVKQCRLYFPGLALPLLAALSPAGWSTEICLETIEDIPWNTDADLIGISGMGHAIIRSLDIADRFRQQGKPVVIGGYMASLMPEEALKHADAVVVGDAETVWPRLLDDFQSGAMQRLYRAEATETLTLPLPRYELLTSKAIGDWLPVQAGRGCPNTCSFCSVYCLYRGRYQRRTEADVLRDIRHIRSLGWRRFILLDDNIYADPEYMLSLCQQISPLGMQWMSQCSITVGRDDRLLSALAASGCMALSFGLESISPESLDAMGKGWAVPSEYPALIRRIRAAGIEVSTEMVVGGEGDTLASIAATAGFIRETRIIVPRFYILTPIPGTDYYHAMQQAGRLCHDDIYRYHGAEAVHKPRNMSPEALTTAYWSLYEDVYSIRSIMQRVWGGWKALRHPLRQLFYLGVNWHYRRSIGRRIPPNIF